MLEAKKEILYTGPESISEAFTLKGWNPHKASRETGISENTLRSWVTDAPNRRRKPSADLLLTLAKKMGVRFIFE